MLEERAKLVRRRLLLFGQLTRPRPRAFTYWLRHHPGALFTFRSSLPTTDNPWRPIAVDEETVYAYYEVSVIISSDYRPVPPPLAEDLLKLVEDRSRVMDIGYSSRRNLAWLLGHEYDAWGLEPSEGMRVEVARALSTLSGRTTNGTYKVNQSLHGRIEFPVPPIEFQREFSEISKKTRSPSVRTNAKSTERENLLSLQQRAFRGEF